MAESIKCPKCHAKMKRIAFHGIEVDQCTQCRGIWFDLLEHEDLKKTFGSELIDTGRTPSDASSDARVLSCPRCQARMGSTHDIEQPHIVYEKCSACSGVFFDAGEFKDFKEYTLAEKLKSWIG